MADKNYNWKLYLSLILAIMLLLNIGISFAATGSNSGTNTTAKLDSVSGNASGGIYTINLAGGLQVVSNYSGGSYEGRFGVFNLNHMPNKPTSNLPLNNSFPKTNYTLLNWTPTDNDNNTIRCFVYGDTSNNPTTVINYTTFGKNGTIQTFNWTNLNQATYYWRVVCSDNSMNSTSSDTLKFRVDTSTPVVTNTTVFVNSTNSLRSGVNGTVFNIHVNVTDAVTNVTSVIAYIQKPDDIIVANVTLTDNDNDSVYNGTWNSTGFEIGTYLIDIVANDTAGNEVEYENRNVILLSQASVGVFINDSITFPANQSVTLNITNTSLTLEIRTRESINGTTLIVTETSVNPKNTTGGVQISGKEALPLGKYFEIQVENSTNDNLSYALITVDYTDNQLTTANLIESSLVLSKYNTSIKNWTKIEQYSLNTTSNKLTANVTSFSTFGVFGEQAPAPREGYGTGGGSSLNSGIANAFPESKSFKLSVEKGKKTLTVKARDLIKFNLTNQEYIFNIIAVLQKQVKYLIGKIKTNKFATFINDGNSTTLDLDNDGKDDIKLKVLSITKIVSRYDANLEIEFLGIAKQQVKEIIVEKPAVTEEPKKIEQPKTTIVEEKKETVEAAQKVEQARKQEKTAIVKVKESIMNAINYLEVKLNGRRNLAIIAVSLALFILFITLTVNFFVRRNHFNHINANTTNLTKPTELDYLKAKIEKESREKLLALNTSKKAWTKLLIPEKTIITVNASHLKSLHNKKSPLNKARLHILVLFAVFSLSVLFVSQFENSITGYTIYDTVNGTNNGLNKYSFVYSGVSLAILLSIILYQINDSKKKLGES